MTFSGFRTRVARLVADNAALFTASAGMAGFILLLTEAKQIKQNLKQMEQNLKQMEQNLKQMEQILVKGHQELLKRIDTLEERITRSTAMGILRGPQR